MKLHSVLFKVPRRTNEQGQNEYERLARVWECSAALNSPQTPTVLHCVGEEEDGDLFSRKQRYTQSKTLDNARKTKHHNQIVQEASDGELLCLMDCDTIVLGDLSPIVREEFDFAYTLRPPKSRFPFNSGVVFVRVSDRTKAFYREWCNGALDEQNGLLRVMRGSITPRFGGINQSALGRLLEKEHGLDILTLPCAVWNYENECYRRMAPIESAKVVHLVPPIKHLCISGGRAKSWFTPIEEKWRAYDRAAQCNMNSRECAAAETTPSSGGS